MSIRHRCAPRPCNWPEVAALSSVSRVSSHLNQQTTQFQFNSICAPLDAIASTERMDNPPHDPSLLNRSKSIQVNKESKKGKEKEPRWKSSSSAESCRDLIFLRLVLPSFLGLKTARLRPLSEMCKGGTFGSAALPRQPEPPPSHPGQKKKKPTNKQMN